MTTIFKHDGKELYRDEADDYGTSEEGIETIRSHYAQFDKRLVTATYTVTKPEKAGEPTVVEFAKKFGSKGAIPVVEALLDVPPANVDPFNLLNEFGRLNRPGGPTPEDTEALKGLDDTVEKAIEAAEKKSRTTYRRVRECLALEPIPSSQPPLGF